MEEELALLEEQLAAAHADLERLQEQLAEAAARARTQESEGAELRRQLAEARQSLTEREEALGGSVAESEALRGALGDAEGRVRAAAGRYRDLLLAAEPDLPAGLIAGDSIEEVDGAADRARQTVAQVRQHLEQQVHSLRVPAGAPVRGAPDPGPLTPAEKIRAGLQDRT